MVKRIFDVILVSLAVPVWLPVIMIFSILMRMSQGSPVFFSQTRSGLNGVPFKVFKFRTMSDDCDSEGRLLPDEQRLTRIGKLLRSTSLDEFPQFVNVLIGHMSLVGPRPLHTHYDDLYTQEQAIRLSVTPGITGWAQVNGRNAISWEERFKLDAWYVANRSLWLDIKILFLAVAVVIRNSDVSHEGSATMPEFTGSQSGRDPN